MKAGFFPGMRTPALAAFLLPALLAGLAGCLEDGPPPPPTGQIDGAVVDQLLRPFSNQTVHLAQLQRTDQTSALGGFTFRDVPAGSYTLLAARGGTEGAVASVTVHAGQVTKVILQLLPTPVRDPHMAIFPPHSSFEDVASYGQECRSCAWTLSLDGAERPAEVVIDWTWDASALGEQGDDGMRFQVLDDQGNLLFRRTAASSPFTASIDGADIPSSARELRVQAWFGSAFTPRHSFAMESYPTVYYGATSDELFGA